MTKHQEAPTAAGGVASKQLQSIVERIERLNVELDGINQGKADIFTEAKGNGYCTKALKAIISERKKMGENLEAFNETAAMIELYRSALGMGGAQIDLFNDPSA